MEDPKGKANALKMSRYLGCSGAHQHEGNWFPCKDQETLMRISNRAEDTSNPLPEERKEAKKKRRKRGSKWEEMGRERGVSSIDTLSGGGLVSGGFAGKAERRVGIDDPDVFTTRRGARIRARQLGCIGIRQYSRLSSGTAWMPCTNESDYRRAMRSSPQGRRDVARDEIRRMRRLLRELEKRKSETPLFRQQKSLDGVATLSLRPIPASAERFIAEAADNHNTKVDYLGLGDAFRADLDSCREVWRRGAKTALTDASKVITNGNYRVINHLNFVLTSRFQDVTAVLDADLMSKDHPWNQLSKDESREFLLDSVIEEKGLFKPGRRPSFRKLFKKPSFDGDKDGFIMNPTTGKDDLPFNNPKVIETPVRVRPRAKRPDATYDKIKKTEGKFPKRIDISPDEFLVRDIAAVKVGDTWVPGRDISRLDQVPPTMPEMPLRTWNGLPPLFQEALVSLARTENDATPEFWDRAVRAMISVGETDIDQPANGIGNRLSEALTDPGLRDKPFKLSAEVEQYINMIGEMRSTLAERQRANPNVNLDMGPRLTDQEFAATVSQAADEVQDRIEMAMNGKYPGVRASRASGVSPDDLDKIIYDSVNASLPAIAAEDDRATAMTVTRAATAAGFGGNVDLETVLADEIDIWGPEVVNDIRRGINRQDSSVSLVPRRDQNDEGEWYHDVMPFSDESYGLPSGVDVPNDPDDPDWVPYIRGIAGISDDVDPDFVPPNNEEILESKKDAFETGFFMVLRGMDNSVLDSLDSGETLPIAFSQWFSNVFEELIPVMSDPMQRAAYGNSPSAVIDALFMDYMPKSLTDLGIKEEISKSDLKGVLASLFTNVLTQMAKTGYVRSEHGDMNW